ncbi:DUF416 family protein [Aliikangiella sp. IMCC44632]
MQDFEFNQQDLNQLNLWQQQLFATALLQRMLPNFDYFVQGMALPSNRLMHNQIDSLWQKLSGLPIKINHEIQLEKLQQITPEPNDYDCFAVFPALNCCTGLNCVLSSFIEADHQLAYEVSRLSLETVTGYLNYVQLQQSQGEAPAALLSNDPLYLWELETQNGLFNLVAQAKQGKASCDAAKVLVTEQRLSNLAIEY